MNNETATLLPIYSIAFSKYKTKTIQVKKGVTS